MEDTKISLDFDLSRNSALFARESLISLVIIVQHRMEYVFMIILYRMIISSASPRNRIVDRLYPIVWRSEELCSISIILHFLCYLIFYLFIFSYVMILPFGEEFIFLFLFSHLAKMIFVFQPMYLIVSIFPLLCKLQFYIWYSYFSIFLYSNQW